MNAVYVLQGYWTDRTGKGHWSDLTESPDQGLIMDTFSRYQTNNTLPAHKQWRVVKRSEEIIVCTIEMTEAVSPDRLREWGAGT